MKKIKWLLFFLLVTLPALSFALSQTVNYIYDNLGRLTSSSYSNGSSIAYQYDPAGNMLSAISQVVDTDNDGIADNIDNCPGQSNADQLDTDNDTLGNICDTDDDDDGLPDSWEVANNLNPLNAADALIDSDNDGFTNQEEYRLNTNPWNNQSKPVTNGICGSSHGAYFTTVPLANLCSAGFPSTIAGTGPWTWSCANLTTVSCSANKLIDDPQQTAFIERFYQNILGRSADNGGMSTWKQVIQTESAAKVAFGFFNSPEFLGVERNNTDFLYIQYQTLFGRLPDQGGLNTWLEQLNNGELRSMVIYGFLRSQEFKNLSDSFNVTSFSTEDESAYQVAEFVKRFYTLVLNRQPDVGGFNNWNNQLNSSTQSGGDIATGFFMSQEFTNRATDDNTFVDICYRAFFGREADAGGKANWLDSLSAGSSRQDVVNGFISSQEFSNLTHRYGIRAQ